MNIDVLTAQNSAVFFMSSPVLHPDTAEEIQVTSFTIETWEQTYRQSEFLH